MFVVLQLFVRVLSLHILESLKDEHAVNMDNGALRYLNQVNDKEQYPAARCAMGDNINKFGWSSLSLAESMNNANMVVRERTAVDAVNASLLWLQLEAKRYNKHMNKAWVWNKALTPHGKKLCKELFQKGDFIHYFTITQTTGTCLSVG
jgi:hypothetical protein